MSRISSMQVTKDIWGHICSSKFYFSTLLQQFVFHYSLLNLIFPLQITKRRVILPRISHAALRVSVTFNSYWFHLGQISIHNLFLFLVLWLWKDMLYRGLGVTKNIRTWLQGRHANIWNFFLEQLFFVFSLNLVLLNVFYFCFL